MIFKQQQQQQQVSFDVLQADGQFSCTNEFINTCVRD